MQLGLPPHLVPQYLPATGNDVRAESFGELTSARYRRDVEDWRGGRGSFDDQAIFGPVRSFRCACGKHSEQASVGIVCDECGVKVAPVGVRRLRAAHINLPEPIVHPLGDGHEMLTALPVLPVAFIEAPNGRDLLDAYAQVICATDATGQDAAVKRLLSLLTPLLVVAHEWNLSDRVIIAHGIALRERDTAFEG